MHSSAKFGGARCCGVLLVNLLHLSGLLNGVYVYGTQSKVVGRGTMTVLFSFAH